MATTQTKNMPNLDSVLKNARDVPHAPVIFFDGVPACAGLGTIHLALSCVRLELVNGEVVPSQAIVAHLACDRKTAIALRDMIDARLLATEPIPGAAN